MKRLDRIASAFLMGTLCIGAAFAAPQISRDKQENWFGKLRQASAADAASGLISPAASAPAAFTKAGEAIRGTVNGAVISYGRGTVFPYWGEIDFATGKDKVLFRSPLFRNSGENYDLQTSAVRRGIVYIPEYTVDPVAGDYQVFWKRFDLNSGVALPSVYFDMSGTAPANRYSYCYSLTYDPNEDLFYGLSYDFTTEAFGTLVSVDPNTWEVKYIGSAGGSESDYMGCLVWNASDNSLYGIRAQGDLCQISKRDGKSSKVIDIDNSAVFPAFRYGQPLTYSPYDNRFITMVIDNQEEAFKMYGIDPDTGHAEALCTMDNLTYYASLYCGDPWAPSEAPDIATFDNADFAGASLSGKVTVEFPKYKYNGTPITAAQIDAEITLDDQTVFTGKVAPGEKKTVDITSTEGLHTLKAQSWLDAEEKSPVLSREIYIGSDAPKAPSALKVTDHTLTWEAPGALGEHNGFVDVNALTYNIFYDGQKQNTAAVSGTSFELPEPAALTNVRITVTAVANGKSSEPSDAIRAILGPALNIPVRLDPTLKQSQLFTVVDANRDGYQFMMLRDEYEWEKDVYDFGFYDTAYVNPNDWLFLPVINFTDTENLYALEYQYMGWRATDDNLESYTIYLCSAPDPNSKISMIFDQDNYGSANREHFTHLFAIPEAGKYYIGIHYHGGTNGVQFREFRVNVKPGSSKAPADPTDVNIEGAEKGELRALINFTAPVKSLTGTDLPKDEELSFAISCGTFSAKATGLPGAKVSASVEVPENGFNRISIIPSSAAGTGIEREHRVYIGLDTPLAPTNVRGEASEDNLTMKLTWDAPTRGENGGYVDPSGLSYRIFANDGSNSSYSNWGTVKGTTTVFNPMLSTMTYWAVAPSAVNSKGNSVNTQPWAENLGVPYEVPATETFQMNGGVLTPWKFMTGGIFENSTWEPVADPSLLGINPGNPTGGNTILMRSLAMSGNVTGEWVLPKVTTKDLDKVMFTLRYCDYSDAGKIQIWGRHYGQTECKMLKEITPEQSVEDKWVDVNYTLPEDFQNSPWVEIRIRGIVGPGLKEYVILDQVGFRQDVEVDLKVKNIRIPAQSVVGDVAECAVTVQNGGNPANTNRTSGTLNIEVVADGKTIDSYSQSVRLRPSEQRDYFMGVHALVDYDKYEKIEIVATVTDDDNADEAPNNNVRRTDWKVVRNDLPVVNDLAAHWNDDHTAVNLTWTVPDASYGAREGFEYEEPFQITDKIGSFTNLDRDGHSVYGITNLTWPNWNKPAAWMVMDANELGTANDARLCAHSGSKYIMARSPEQPADVADASEFLQASDWLISPEVVGGTELSFWYCTIQSGLTEYVELWESSTDDNPDSFTKTRTFSKNGDDAWDYVSITLKPTTKHFALVYASFDSHGALLDDIAMTPVQLSKWEIDHYALFKHTAADWSDNECVGNDITETSFTHPNADTNAYYALRTFIKGADGQMHYGPFSNVAAAYSTAIDDITALTGVAGENGRIRFKGHNGKQAAVYTSDGRIARVVNLASDNQTELFDAGIYLVKIGNAVTKLIVK